MIARAKRAVASKGPLGVARVARDRAMRELSASESHIWYELAVAGERPRRALPEGLELRLARSDAELEAVERLPGSDPADVMRRGIAAGHALWLVADGDRAAFACWLQYGAAPLYAAPHHSLELPPGVVCLEDSVTSPDHRGQGIAPAAWCLLADSVAAAGLTTMITKVETENQPSRRAVEKAGFREIATMKLHRRWPTTRVTVAAGDGGLGLELATRILG